ncbi:hypothetical protein [Paenibacillus sp. L3-i20]|uniref:hypothetical protein n=1 Tax=Paenibacillus sp. L3-i20 TaxID=2905833 RepID=UPI001EE03C51|nr:hypothetical protein [Paenibacillus sp. L3-i20]GKU78411.1 hypothetical protein L3i20_v228080 [Paenibacillus sp. L3-i20]
MYMQRLLIIVLFTLIMITGCESKSESKEQTDDKILVYYGKGQTWASTLTFFEDRGTIFESLYIQHIGNRQAELKPFEYVLEGEGIKSASTYPQKLQGVRSFQVSSEFNSDYLNLVKNKQEEYNLSITHDGITEKLVLKIIKE